MSHPLLVRRTSMSEEIGRGASHSNRGTREAFVQCGPVEMEIGFRLDRRAATYSMPPFRRLTQVSFWLGSHPMAAWVVRFIAQVTVVIYGLRCWLCRAKVVLTSSLLPAAQRTSALRTASDEVRTMD